MEPSNLDIRKQCRLLTAQGIYLDVGEAILDRVYLLHHPLRRFQQRLQHLRSRCTPLTSPAQECRASATSSPHIQMVCQQSQSSIPTVCQ